MPDIKWGWGAGGIHAISSLCQSVRSVKNLNEISQKSVRFFLGAIFYRNQLKYPNFYFDYGIVMVQL